MHQLERLAYNLPHECYKVGDSCGWNQIMKDGITYWYNASGENDIRWKQGP